ncbi:hypothetical protein K466DRAFT_85061 [Polyporus arcularius HHB13444]|uniref:Uncharacterized protein n=1 Tax=Polyporus arcularius HHB13444 TaxID=1314778 RepID=A0A5C3PII1_9APHY|nr:hypothetical protein K466DRAFT_85061 [Polyporus arcularius HHB13444]
MIQTGYRSIGLPSFTRRILLEARPNPSLLQARSQEAIGPPWSSYDRRLGSRGLRLQRRRPPPPRGKNPDPEPRLVTGGRVRWSLWFSEDGTHAHPGRASFSQVTSHVCAPHLPTGASLALRCRPSALGLLVLQCNLRGTVTCPVRSISTCAGSLWLWHSGCSLANQPRRPALSDSERRRGARPYTHDALHVEASSTGDALRLDGFPTRDAAVRPSIRIGLHVPGVWMSRTDGHRACTGTAHLARITSPTE